MVQGRDARRRVRVREPQAVSAAPFALLGAVLAGGRSSRMGQDKAGLRVGEESFLAHAVRIVQSVCAEAVISLRPDAPCLEAARETGLPPVWDDGLHGPMGGLVSCLREAEMRRLPAVLACACDMPLLTPDLLAFVCRAREKRPAGALATAPLLPGKSMPEPLCAVWETAALPVLVKALAEGRYGLFRALPAEAWHTVACPASLAAGLSNVNTPQEYAAVHAEKTG